jgi:hypothetical protein
MDADATLPSGATTMLTSSVAEAVADAVAPRTPSFRRGFRRSRHASMSPRTVATPATTCSRVSVSGGAPGGRTFGLRAGYGNSAWIARTQHIEYITAGSSTMHCIAVHITPSTAYTYSSEAGGTSAACTEPLHDAIAAAMTRQMGTSRRTRGPGPALALSSSDL